MNNVIENTDEDENNAQSYDRAPATHSAMSKKGNWPTIFTMANVFDNVKPGVVIFHRRSVEYINSSALQMLEIPDGMPYIGKSVLALVHTESLKRIQEHLDKLEELASIPVTEEKLTSMKGKELDVMISSSSFVESRKVYVIVFIHDITDKKKAEQALLESEAKYKTLISNASDGILIVYHKTIVFLNKKIEELTGFSSSELLNTGIHKLVHIDDLINIAQYINDRLPGQSFEARLMNKDGKAIQAEWISAKVVFEHKDCTMYSIHDLTHRMERRLKMQILSQVVEYSTNSIMITNPDGIISYVNQSLVDVTGYTREELIGQHTSILRDVDSQNEAAEELWETIRQGKDWKGEFVNRKKNGEKYIESSNVSSIKDEQGRILYYFAIKEDITGRKGREKAIAEQNTNLKVLNECYSAMLQNDDINALGYALCEICTNTLSYDLAIYGRIDMEETTPKFRMITNNSSENQKIENEQLSKELNNINILAKVVNSEIYYCDKTEEGNDCSLGSLHHLYSTMAIVPLKTSAKENYYIIVFSSNQLKFNEFQKHLLQELVRYYNLGFELITEKIERIKAEHQSTIEKEKLSKIISSIGDGVITIDINSVITFMNKSAGKILNVKPSSMLGTNFFSQLKFVDEKNKLFYNPFDATDTETNLLNRTYTFIDTQNKKYSLFITTDKIIGEDNNLLGYVILIKDITKQIKMDAQAALSQKMEAVGQLAAGIAHEINTPMQFVGDNTFFLKDGFASLTDYIKVVNELIATGEIPHDMLMNIMFENRKHYDVDYLSDEIPIAIDRTLQGIERVRNIIVAMKNFAHSSGKNKSLANLNEGIEVTVTISKNEWKYVADLNLNLQKDMPLVYCSMDQINQVLLNMIINATHAILEKQLTNSSHKGIINISTELEQETNNVLITIEDNGCGIPADKISRIYDPFYTTKEVGKGTGQGLAIAHDIIVDKHGGAIDVSSELGKGTLFYIRLPLEEE